MSPLPTYLRTHRQRWALSQRELGLLVGVSRSSIAKYETLAANPSFDVAIATETVLGISARDLFPAIYRRVDDGVGQRAAGLDRYLRNRTDRVSQRKLGLLGELAERLAPPA